MKKICFLLLLGSIFSLLQLQGQNTWRDMNKNGIMDLYENAKAPLEERVEDLLSRLTVAEKVELLTGNGMKIPGVSETRMPEKVNGQASSTMEIERLGLGSMVLADGPAGLRIQPKREGEEQTYFCTAFPIATLMASTWDLDMVEKVGQAMGNEVKEYGVDILLAPGMNIHRNPLSGRNFEYFSEDPYLTGHMSAAMVKGVQSNGVGTSIKHFVANNQETNRMLLNVLVDQRSLREIYLRPFEISIRESAPRTVMSAYNKINGEFASHNHQLLSKVLREDWGYQGLVMTDWNAGNDVVAQMKAGNDLLMPGNPEQKKALHMALNSGELSEVIIDENVKRILRVLLQSPAFQGYQYSDQPDLKAHAKLARKAAAEGAILLKNENALPLKRDELKIAAFGISSFDYISGGSGSGNVNAAYTISMVEGLRQEGFDVDEKLEKMYKEYIKEEKAKQPPKAFFLFPDPPVNEMPVEHALIKQKAKQADIAIITIGRNSGEFEDRKLAGDFHLTESEKSLISNISNAFHKQDKKVVVVLNIGNVIEMVSWQDQVDAILLPWQGGQEAGYALADVLTGNVNPSGKLPMTFPINYQDVPTSNNFPGENFPGAKEQKIRGLFKNTLSEVSYEEGIYVGYRHFSTFNKEVAYPFGYGISYTQFEYGVPSLSSDSYQESMEVSIQITNSGKLPGKEVVQLYLSAPEGKLKKPALELKAFAKTKILEPGESQTLSFSLTSKDLASFSVEESAWMASAGTYTLKIGASCEDIRAQATFDLSTEMMVEKVNDVLKPVSLMPGKE